MRKQQKEFERVLLSVSSQRRTDGIRSASELSSRQASYHRFFLHPVSVVGMSRGDEGGGESGRHRVLSRWALRRLAVGSESDWWRMYKFDGQQALSRVKTNEGISGEGRTKAGHDLLDHRRLSPPLCFDFPKNGVCQARLEVNQVCLLPGFEAELIKEEGMDRKERVSHRAWR